MKFDITKQIESSNSFNVSAVMGKFDLKSNVATEHFVGEIDLDKNWNIGVIVGHSGTGKSTIANHLFKITNKFEYKEKSIMDDMPTEKTVDEIVKTFNSVGFSSPPSWLKPYSVLSTGEKMRVDLARAILSNEDIIVFDEFTSVVDRTVAKIGSYALQKAIRRDNKQFIAVSCHDDILDWLEPDWVFSTNDMTMLKKKDKDQKLNCQYTKKKVCGTFLKNIII